MALRMPSTVAHNDVRGVQDAQSRDGFYDVIDESLDATMRSEGLWKSERSLTSSQGGTITTGGQRGPDFCANNYLGLADDPQDPGRGRRGYGKLWLRDGIGSFHLWHNRRAPCTRGQRSAEYLGTDDSISFAACFDANGGALNRFSQKEADAIVSDSLNHASIIDGIRLCKAGRYRFAGPGHGGSPPAGGESKGRWRRTVLIVTDGVFSMDGYVADLASICAIADDTDSLVMVDDCHATGLVGPQGRGTPALHGVAERVDIVSGTLGKALGGGMGGFIAARQNVVDLLRQRARPYLFSNALAPGLVGGGRAGLQLAKDGDALRARLDSNARQFRAEMAKAGFTLSGDGHPIIPVMIGDARLASQMADGLLARGVYVTAFSFPVVPKGTARIRTQMCAAHAPGDVDRAVAAFVAVGTELGVLGGAA